MLLERITHFELSIFLLGETGTSLWSGIHSWDEKIFLTKKGKEKAKELKNSS